MVDRSFIRLFTLVYDTNGFVFCAINMFFKIKCNVMLERTVIIPITGLVDRVFVSVYEVD